MEWGGIPKGRGGSSGDPFGGQDLGLRVAVWGLRGHSWGLEVVVEVLEVETGRFGVRVEVLGGQDWGFWGGRWRLGVQFWALWVTGEILGSKLAGLGS